MLPVDQRQAALKEKVQYLVTLNQQIAQKVSNENTRRMNFQLRVSATPVVVPYFSKGEPAVVMTYQAKMILERGAIGVPEAEEVKRIVESRIVSIAPMAEEGTLTVTYATNDSAYADTFSRTYTKYQDMDCNALASNDILTFLTGIHMQ